MRKTVTIPAAGETKGVQITGRSLVVESCGIFSTPEEVPTFNFTNGIKSNPIYPRSTYQNDDCFNSIEITGTAESAGSEVVLLTYEECLGTDLNINTGQTKKSIAGQTFSKTSTDNAKALSEIDLERNGLLPTSIYVSARGNQIVYGFVDGGAAPNQTAEWHTLNVDDQPLEIQGIDFILKFQFASAAAGTPAELIVTPEY